MRKFNLLHIATAVTLLACALAGEVHAAGSGRDTPAPSYDASGRGHSLEQQSDKAFRSGLKQRDRALKHEAKAARAKSDKSRDKALAKAQKAYTKAIEKQGEALQLNPQNYKAANELGFALRKTGDYRGEAFLALGMFEQTKKSYMVLFREDRELAAQLMSRFDEWVAAQGDGLDEDQTAFVAWIDERKRVARITSDLSMNNTRAW